MSPNHSLRQVGYIELLSVPLCLWDQNQSSLMSLTFQLRTFLGQQWFQSGEDPSSFHCRYSNELTSFCDIMSKGNLCTKQDLQKKINRHIPWYKNVQVKHFMNRSIYTPNPKTKLSSFGELMMASALSNKGLVSKIHSIPLRRRTYSVSNQLACRYWSFIYAWPMEQYLVLVAT